MSTQRPKKSQKEEPLKVDMTPDELLLLMGRSTPLTKKELEDYRASKKKAEEKEKSEQEEKNNKEDK